MDTLTHARALKRKPILVASVFLVVMVAAAFLVFSGIGLALFDVFLGNDVYALQVKYVPSTDSFGNAKVSFTLDLVTTRMPIETVLTGSSVKVDAAATFDDGNFSISFYVQTTVANDIVVYGRTFSFQDGQARTLTCYLKDYSAQKYPVIKASLSGSTVYNGFYVGFSGYGGQWTN